MPKSKNANLSVVKEDRDGWRHCIDVYTRARECPRTACVRASARYAFEDNTIE